jgi:predicted CoA-substrate-specific enzyme activase
VSGEAVHVYGIDLGSRAVKIAERTEGRTRPLTTCPTSEFYLKYITMRDGRHVLKRGELGLEEGVAIASTGYGRQRLPGEEAKMVPELKAIALGVAEQVEREECVVLDIGGQDIKAIRLRNGMVGDFATNDRCAASSGRYLENMAAVLGMTLEELTGYYQDPVELSSTCAVFGETELVGLLAEGHAPARLAAGVNQAVCSRILPLLARFPGTFLVVTGGVARNPGLIRMLSEATEYEILVLRHPEFIAARGCCLA